MASLVGVFRAAARRRPCTLQLAATRASSSSATSRGPEFTSLGDIGDELKVIAEQQEELKVATEGESQFDGIVDTVPVFLPHSNGYPILKGFMHGQFTQPKRFSRAEYEKMRMYTKRWALGPDAATSKQLDVFHQRGLDPLKECQNTSIMSRFVTTMGKIKGRSETNLTWKNQRRMGKAIRRAKMMGLIPVLSKRELFLSSMDYRPRS